MLAIAIEDLEVHLSSWNLPIRNSAICYKFLAQKEETGKQIAGALY